MGNISYVIDNFEYKLDMNTFWFCSEVCYLEILLNQESNDWIIGIKFLNAYSITFDYEDRNVHFYSNENVWRVSNNKSKHDRRKGKLNQRILLF